MQINIIAACDRNGIIGKNGMLPWSINEDMQRFKELTLGHAVIMGRKTWYSLPSRPLPGRKNIILTSGGPSYTCQLFANLDKCYWITSAIDQALWEARYDKTFIAGGESLYRQMMPLADRVYLTRVDTEVEVGPNDTVARFPLEEMEVLFRMESEDQRDGFSFTEWVKK